MRIQHNIKAMNARRNFSKNTKSLSKNLEKLSSGYRINRSADDAAGLAISEKMRAQISGMDRGMDNAQEGINLIQTADGALTEVHDILNRMTTLSNQAANGTYTEADRTKLDAELTQLKDEVDRIGNSSNFNGIYLFKENLGDPNVHAVRTFNYRLKMDSATGTFRAASVGTNPAVNYVDVSNVDTGYRVLAEKIAQEYFPNAVNQIMDTFSSLKDSLLGAIPGDFDITLELGDIDGSGNTLAYASVSYTRTPDTPPVSLTLRVDSSDFSDGSISSDAVEMLESTIAHEVMHTIMQSTMTDEMTGRTGAGEEFPTWFVEGTAQLAGGGFPTGWNYAVEELTKTLADANDKTNDTLLADYLADYTVDGRPYGHGYLAAAYLGYLANGGTGDVTAGSIANGMNRIFQSIIDGNTLAQAVTDLTDLDPTDITDLTNKLNGLFTANDPTNDLVSFVRQLGVASNGGAGSVIAQAGLSIGDTGILKHERPLDIPYKITDFAFTGAMPGSTGRLPLVIGSEGQEDTVYVNLYEMNTETLNLKDCNLSTIENAHETMDTVKSAIETVSAIRGYYGAMQNRLDHTIQYTGVMSENLTNAESVIRDTDVADEMMRYTKNNILTQSAQAMLAQANSIPSGILSLLK